MATGTKLKATRQFGLLIGVALAAVLFVTAASADQIRNTLDNSVDATFEVMSLNVGGSDKSAVLAVIPQNGDGKNGCNLTAGTTLVVSVNSSDPGVATVSPSSITLSSCGDTPSVTVHPVSTGSANITLGLISNNTGATFDLDPARFTATVAPPPNTGPSVSVTGVTHGASYEFGSVPTAGCLVSDMEDGLTNSTSAASPTLSSIVGPNAGLGLGSQTADCSYTDGGGLTTTASASYTIVDTTPPTLHSVPSDMTLEATSPVGATATWSAITATDAVSGSVAVNCNHNSGEGFPLGTTNVTCSATDAVGNSSSASFNVTVQDTTGPSFSGVPADITVEATSGSGNTITYTNPTASDFVDGIVAVSCSPSSGSIFPLGETTVHCSATDAHGNTGSASFKVTVQDTTPPALSGVPADITKEATSAAGAVANYSNPTASDTVDGTVTVMCSPSSGSIFPLGETTVHCSATDAHGNTGSASFKVTVQDTTPPGLNLPSDITVLAAGPSGGVVSYSASATDLVDGAVPVTCSPASGTTFAVGPTTVSCSASDSRGNNATGSFKVTVLYDWNGFFQPIDNKDGTGKYVLNKAKAGSTIPTKFSLGGDMGLSIFATGYPVSASISCDGTASADVIEEYAATGTVSGLKYDPLANQYIYSWKTESAWGGKCRQLIVKLSDGSEHRASFQFFK